MEAESPGNEESSVTVWHYRRAVWHCTAGGVSRQCCHKRDPTLLTGRSLLS